MLLYHSETVICVRTIRASQSHTVFHGKKCVLDSAAVHDVHLRLTFMINKLTLIDFPSYGYATLPMWCKRKISELIADYFKINR